jgi:hypothetical protein
MKKSPWREKEIHAMNSDLETERWKLLNENILYQLMTFDWPTFLLTILTSKRREEEGYTFDSLLGTISEYGYFIDPERIVLKGLDTLLDFGIYKPSWKEVNGHWQRVFFNRSELVAPYAKYKDELLKPTKSTFPIDKESMKIIERLYKDTLMRPLEKFDEVESLEKRKRRIEDDISTFIERYLRPKCKEYERVLIIPTIRKGAVLLKHLGEEKLKDLDIEYSGYLRKDRLTGKHIILFDDATKSGATIKEYVDLLTTARGIRREDITIATYCVHKKCPKSVKKEIEIGPMKELKDEEFRREVGDIILYIASLGEIIDPDHLVIKAKFESPQRIKNVIKSLKELEIGELLEPDLEHLHPTRQKVTINLKKEEYEQYLPEEVKKVDICKLRFLFEYKDDYIEGFNIIPIINPVIPRLSEEEQNKIIERYNFDKIIKNGETFYDIPPYVDAIICHMATSILKRFLSLYSQKIKEDSKFIIEKISCDYFESKYHPNFNMFEDGLRQELEEQYLQGKS